jgi:hypothetical protein
MKANYAKEALVTPSSGVAEEMKKEREAGVGFAVKTSLVRKLLEPPKGINNRLMTMRLPLSYDKKHIIIISCYAPTMTNTEK